MMIIATLAVAALPRLLDRKIFDSRGFSDQSFASLRYAQKMAISQRRTVCVAFGANTISLTLASLPGAIVCNTNLASPSGTSPYTVSANSGITFGTVPTNFQFNALGQASIGQTISVTGATGAIIIEPDTGYVHP